MKGVCQFCGCTADNACVIEDEGRTTPCAWADAEQTICSGCLDQVDALTLCRLTTAEMQDVESFSITLRPDEWWALAMFLQESIVAHGNHDAGTNPTLHAAVVLAIELNRWLCEGRPAMRESLERSGENLMAEYEGVTIDGASLSPGGIILP